MKIAITGVLGNLGWKLTKYLSTREVCTQIIGLDIHDIDDKKAAELQEYVRESGCRNPAQLSVIPCDLSDWHDDRWGSAIHEADVIIHFAAQNPFPGAFWEEARNSLDMTMNLAAAAEAGSSVHRFIFASSNHVMGRYKDSPLSDSLGPGELTTDKEEGVGTIWQAGGEDFDSTSYAISKFAGESRCRSLAARNDGRIQCICIRIGWCQPGENLPETLNAAGVPIQDNELEQTEATSTSMGDPTAWFRGMWLSNRDFVHLFECAITAEDASWPGDFIIVNGVSNNSGMKWSLTEAQRWLGYQPQDNVNNVSSI